MVPVDLETQIPEVELTRLGDVKDAEDWDDRLKLDVHPTLCASYLEEFGADSMIAGPKSEGLSGETLYRIC